MRVHTEKQLLLQTRSFIIFELTLLEGSRVHSYKSLSKLHRKAAPRLRRDDSNCISLMDSCHSSLEYLKGGLKTTGVR